MPCLYCFYSWGLPQPRGTLHKTQSSAGPRTPTSPREGENPWTRRSSESQTVKFSSIVEDEIQQRESLMRATNKPLALIQVWPVILHRIICLINSSVGYCNKLLHITSNRFPPGGCHIRCIQAGAAILHGPAENVFSTKVGTLNSNAGG